MRDERDAQGRPICQVCSTPIRFIEEVSDPRGRAVHFYCLAAARARQATPARHTTPEDAVSVEGPGC